MKKYWKGSNHSCRI